MSQNLAVAGASEKLLAEGTKSVRMISVLLAACDPCGYMHNGGSAHDYTRLAWQVEGALRAGMGASQLKALLQTTCAMEDPARFCEAAVDWWQRSSRPQMAAA